MLSGDAVTAQLIVDLSVSASQMIVLTCRAQSREMFSWMLETHRAARETATQSTRTGEGRILMMMKSRLSGLFLLLLLSSCVSGLGSVVSKRYEYFMNHYTWQQAQSFCRGSNYYTDLATIFRQSDADGLHMERYDAWIGLHKPETFSIYDWRWSDKQFNLFNQWAYSEPDYNDDCAYVYSSNQRFYGTTCGGYYFFICHERSHHNYHYTFIPQSKMWAEAQEYCRNQFDDLATLEGSSDLSSAVRQRDFPVWTGLHRDGQTWKWSRGISEYRNWASDEPGNNGDCVSISSVTKKMATQNCSDRFPYVCFRDNVFLVKENKTWEEALEHCRELGYELLSVQPGQDHDDVINRVMGATTEKVWAGLHFLAGYWLWVNGANMLYSDLPPCPLERQQCGALSKNDTGSVEPTNCSETLNFLCYSTS